MVATNVQKACHNHLFNASEAQQHKIVVFIKACVCVPVNYKPFTVTHLKSEIGAYQPDLTGNRLSYIVRRPFPQRTVYFWLFLTEVARFP